MDKLLQIVPGYRAMRSAGTITGIVPPARPVAVAPVYDGEAIALPSVFRAVQILTTSVAQLSLDVEKQDTVLDRTPALVRRPNLDMSRSEWLARIVESMAFTGNAYLKRDRAGDGSTINIDILNPHRVRIDQDQRGHLSYCVDGDKYDRRDIEHLKFLPPMPGNLYGLGPIQAAQSTMRSSVDMSAYMGRWFSESGQPTGILSSKQKLTAEQALRHRNVWNGLNPDGTTRENPTDNPSGIKVLDADTSYQPTLLNPKDAMFLEAQGWTTKEIARIFGVPSSLMLVALDGNSMTYANVEQEWLSFVRFTLMGYLRPIEEALTALTPNGQTVRFNIETLLRTDTKSRYDAHAVALANGFMTVEEVRRLENLPPLDRTATQEATNANA